MGGWLQGWRTTPRAAGGFFSLGGRWWCSRQSRSCRSPGIDQAKTERLAAVGFSDANFLGEVQELAAVVANVSSPVVSLNPGYTAAYSPVWSAQFRRLAVSPKVFGRGSVVADELLVVAAHELTEYLAEETRGTVISPGKPWWRG